jgi:hypothetical protein
METKLAEGDRQPHLSRISSTPNLTPHFIALDVSIATNVAHLARASQAHSTSRCKEANIKVKTPFSTYTDVSDTSSIETKVKVLTI